MRLISKKERMIIDLMDELKITQFSIGYELGQDGPNGPDVLLEELLIAIDTTDGATTYLPYQELVWGDKMKEIVRLKDLLDLD